MEQPLTHQVAIVVLQLGIILLAAKLFAEGFERYLKQPAVLGELVAGVLIGPYALGAILPGPLGGPLFSVVAAPGTALPVEREIYLLAQLGSVILLFHAGLETDIRLFLRVGGRAAVIALGGVVVPFASGAYAIVLLGYAPHVLSPLALAPPLGRGLRRLETAGAMVTAALALGFLGAAVAEMFGLAMIIGAYTMGLALSNTDIAERLRHELAPVYDLLAPVFFVVMGMFVDFGAMRGVLGLGALVTLLAILSKVGGCGLPALAAGFTRHGSLRVGVGMLPRGEVALIIAGVGLAAGVIGPDMFGVAVLMTFVTTLLAPILLVPLFTSVRPGTRGAWFPARG